MTIIEKKNETILNISSQVMVKVEVDGREMHTRSLNQTLRPYGRELKRRYDEGDPNIFFKKRKQKHIYTYYLNKKIKRKIKKLDIIKNNS